MVGRINRLFLSSFWTPSEWAVASLCPIRWVNRITDRNPKTLTKTNTVSLQVNYLRILLVVENCEASMSMISHGNHNRSGLVVLCWRGGTLSRENLAGASTSLGWALAFIGSMHWCSLCFLSVDANVLSHVPALAHTPASFLVLPTL